MKRDFLSDFLLNWLPLLFWLLVIFYLSNQPNLTSGLEYDWYLRKSAHFLEFFILLILFLRVLKREIKSFWGVIMLSLFLTLIYAGIDEYHQGLVIGRVASFIDWLIDGFGAVLAMLVIICVKIKKPQWLGLKPY
jgi:VanZ family protein